MAGSGAVPQILKNRVAASVRDTSQLSSAAGPVWQSVSFFENAGNARKRVPAIDQLSEYFLNNGSGRTLHDGDILEGLIHHDLLVNDLSTCEIYSNGMQSGI